MSKQVALKTVIRTVAMQDEKGVFSGLSNRSSHFQYIQDSVLPAAKVNLAELCDFLSLLDRVSVDIAIVVY